MNLRSKSFGELSREMDNRLCYLGKINSNQNAFHVAASSIIGTALSLKIVKQTIVPVSFQGGVDLRQFL
jgi:hypothetical protein